MVDTTPLKLFIDAEFTDFIDQRLISIGVVAENGEELYAELSDTYTEADCSTFVLDTVLPLLECGDARMTERECAGWLHAWIESFGQPVILISDAPQFDGPLVRDLLGLVGWPKNLADHCIRFDGDDYDYFEENPDATRHHALHDARAAQHGYMKLYKGG